jgi:hypothetical protein
MNDIGRIAPHTGHLVSVKDAAKEAGVSTRSVNRAKAISAIGSDSFIHTLKTGNVSLACADQIVKKVTDKAKQVDALLAKPFDSETHSSVANTQSTSTQKRNLMAVLSRPIKRKCGGGADSRKANCRGCSQGINGVELT